MSGLNLEAPGLSSKCHVASKLTEEHRNDSVCPFLRSFWSCDSCDGGFATPFCGEIEAFLPPGNLTELAMDNCHL